MDMIVDMTVNRNREQKTMATLKNWKKIEELLQQKYVRTIYQWTMEIKILRFLQITDFWMLV